MQLYKTLYHTCLIRVQNKETNSLSSSFHYIAEAYNPFNGDQFKAEGSSDTEALHKLRGKIDFFYGKERITGN